MAEPNDSFLREVQDEVRRDQLAKLADRYGIPVAAGLAVLAAIIGGFYWYSALERDAAEKASNTLVVAERFLREEKRDEAKADLEALAKSGDGAPRTLAALRLAALALEDGKADEARALFEAVANDASANPKFRDHARIQLVALDIDSLDFTEAKNRLTGLTDDQSSWRHSARELLAIAALNAKRFDDAKQVLASVLGDNAAPQAVRLRAQMMMSVITADERSAAKSPSEDANDAPKSAEKDAGAGAGSGSGAANDAGGKSGTGAVAPDEGKKPTVN